MPGKIMKHWGTWYKFFLYLLLLSLIECLFMSVEAGMAEERGVIQAQEASTNDDKVSTEKGTTPTVPQRQTGKPETGVTHTITV